jgi:putative membrane-bound dehydrogenase-like protein
MMRLFRHFVLIAMSLGCLAAILPNRPALAQQEEPDFSAELPRIPPKEPAEAMKTFEVLPGFRLEQAAAEPLVNDPVAMAFDERGRLFVVEMRDYSEQDKDFLGVIRLLEDTDQDGKFDKSTVYCEELSWPTAAICYDGGLFVGAAPDIFYLKDTDGDGKADQRKVVFTGFGRSNVQGLINTFQWGLDNRIHGATSSSGAEVTRPGKPDDKPVVLRGRDFAFDPRTLVMQPTSGGAQHGMTFDNWGRKFVCSNSDHIQMVMFEDRYLARNPYLPAPSPRVSIAADGPQAEVYRISPVEPWRIVRTRLRVSGAVKGAVEGGGRAAGYFTGATGTTIYRGNAFSQEYVGQAFVGDVGSNIVHRKVLKPNGVGFTAYRADERREFIASTDTWFRPAQYANAPDGALYIADVYREVIEHPASIPPMIKKHLDLTSGRDRGRIYRVVPEGYKQPPLPRLDKAATAELVATLENDNGWHRDTAARLLFERQDKSAVEPLAKLATASKVPEARMHALYVLDGLGALDSKVVLSALGDKHPRVREHAIRLSERVAADSADVRAKLIALASDDDLRVRYQLAFTLGELEDPKRFDALAAIARRDGDDRWMKLAVMSSLADGAGEVLSRLVSDAESRQTKGAQAVLASLAAQVGAQKKPEAVAAVVKALEKLPASEAALQSSLLRGLNDGLVQSGGSLRTVLAAAKASDATDLVDRLIAGAKQRAADDKASIAARVQAVGALSLGSLDEVGSTLASLLDNKQPQEVQLAALAVLGRHNAPLVAEAILAAWPGMSPRVRNQASDDLLARPQRVAALLDAIEQGVVSATELDPARIKLLQTHRDKKIADRAAKLLASQKLSARNEVVEQYRSVLAMPGDIERGRGVFKKICSTCHKLEGMGHEIGPNLATMQSRGAEAILVNVLDPNREVNPQYVNYVLVTDDGRQMTGMIAAETATSVTLKRAEGLTDTVLRLNIDQLQSTRQSIMPEGMEKQIDPQSMSDLLAYLTKQVGESTSGTWKAGAAKLAITPQQNMWMSGYGSRNKPSEGKLTDLWAKALVIEDPRGERAVMVTLDLVGIDRDLMLDVQRQLHEKHKLEPRQISLCTSHTHCGPVVGGNLESMYFLDETQQKLVDDYTGKLKRAIVAVVDAAFNKLAPAELAWGNGQTDFAVNRRNNKEAEVPAIRQRGEALKGPVDHDVPVLKVTGADGKLKAVAFGYACHATVLGFFQWCADYPGFAQSALEKAHPGAVALFWAGCGADQNPLPRRTVELAQKYGQQLAEAVERVLVGEMKPIAGSLATTYQEIDLPLDKLPSRADLVRDTMDSNRYVARRAKLLLQAIENGKPLSPTYPYPVQTWRLGPELKWVTLGGEVVVDYSLRIKNELGQENTWVAGYTNDVMAYIASLRVLKEGGYEGGGAMVYYGLPTVWAPEVEEVILQEVHRQSETKPETAAGSGLSQR